MPIFITYTSLEPSYADALGISAPTFSTGEAVSLLASTSFLYSLGIMVSVVAAGIMYMRAGAIRMQASERAVSKSNEEIKRVTLGLLGVLSLFVIIYTFNRDLLTGTVGFESLKTQGYSSGGGGNFGGGGATGNTGGATTTQNASYAARKASHEATVAKLAPHNIKTNYNNTFCTEAQFDQKKPECTSLAYLPEETIQMLIKLKGLCNCTVTITGGTEPGHSSHGENRRPVDLRLGGTRGDPGNKDPLYQYIKSVATSKLGSSDNCYERYVYSSFTFCDEKPPTPQHFHVN